MIKITFYRPRIFTRTFWREWKQRHKQGFIDEDTFSLEFTIAKFVAPRLKRFHENEFRDDCSNCGRNAEWCRMVNKMIWSMEQIAKSNGGDFIHPDDLTDEEVKIYYKKLQEGLTLFGKNFRGLWW